MSFSNIEMEMAHGVVGHLSQLICVTVGGTLLDGIVVLKDMSIAAGTMECQF